MIEWAQLASRLQQARLRANVELRQLAEAADVPLDALRSLEAGRETRISTAALARVERELHLPDMWLWSDDPPGSLEISMHFLHAGVADFLPVDEEAAREAVTIASVVRELDHALGRKPLARLFEVRAPGPVAWEDGYNRARQVRRALADRAITDENSPLPSNLDLFIEDELGIPVLDETLATPSVIALTAKLGDVSAIILNTAPSHATTNLGRRVVLAHELCHALFDEPAQQLGLWVERGLEEDIRRPGDPVEQRARAFAAELLLPKGGLRHLLGPAPSAHVGADAAAELVSRTVREFGATPRTAAFHLSNHGYIPEHLKEAAAKQAVVLPPTTGREQLLVRRARAALHNGLISADRAREILGLSAWDTLPGQHS